jgi:hypothetical protein
MFAATHFGSSAFEMTTVTAADTAEVSTGFFWLVKV